MCLLTNATEKNEMKYSNGNSILEVKQNGKGFISIRHYPATKRTPAESVEKKHRAYSAIEAIIKKHNYMEVV